MTSTALRELDGWDNYVANVAALNTPTGTPDMVVDVSFADYVPEGIAVDDDGVPYVGSIHTGVLVKTGTNPKVYLEGDDSWAVFGMRFHADGSLWFASAAVPQFKDAGDDEGKTGLFRLDLASGELTRAAELPQYEENQVLGDLVIADDNTLYTTDSLTGAIYRYYIDSNEFEVLIDRGKLGSPQGLVLDESANFLYVADYIGGLYRVSLLDGSMLRLDVPDNVVDYGIDGLYRRGNELIAIVNGNRPHRVVAFTLNDSGSAIESSRVLASNLDEFDEPTLGVVNDDSFYFVANSHWNRFDRENKLPDGLAGPIILRIPLD